MVVLEVIREVGELALVSFGRVYGGQVVSYGVVKANPETQEWRSINTCETTKTLSKSEKNFEKILKTVKDTK